MAALCAAFRRSSSGPNAIVRYDQAMPISRTTSAPQRIAVLAFDGISPFHLSAPCLVLGEGRRVDGVPPWRLQVCSWQRGPLRTSAGFSIGDVASLRVLGKADVVIVPSWHDPQAMPPPALCRALRAAHARGALVVGLCLGAFVLAAAGLLDGKRATTHWAWAEAFTRQYPHIPLQPEVLYEDQGDVVTSAGTAASLDCCLHLLRRWCGADVANRVARRLVLAPHRAGGQAQFIDKPLPAASADTRLNALLQWLQAHLAQPHTIDALATRVAMSRRSFTRHFQQATGTSVVQWLQHQRLAQACRLLEQTSQRIDQVAEHCGLQTALNLRVRFKAVYGVAPSAYRRQFQAAR